MVVFCNQDYESMIDLMGFHMFTPTVSLTEGQKRDLNFEDLTQKHEQPHRDSIIILTKLN